MSKEFIFFYTPPSKSWPFKVGIQIIIREDQLFSLSFSEVNTTNVNQTQNPNVDSLQQTIIKYLEKYFVMKKINHHEIWQTLGFDHYFQRPFTRNVLKITANIPFGTIITYSELGKKILSRAYQSIGSSLRRNPFPILIPCHRIVGQSSLGGYMGNTDPQSLPLRIKHFLLEFEAPHQDSLNKIQVVPQK